MRVMEEMQAKQRAKQERLRKLKAKADATRRARQEAGSRQRVHSVTHCLLLMFLTLCDSRST